MNTPNFPNRLSDTADTDLHAYVSATAARVPGAPGLPATILPAVAWQAIGRAAPVRVPLGNRHPLDPLPEADIVIITWTSAEWFALDHVFLRSDQPRDFAARDFSWKNEWKQYSRNVGQHAADEQSGLLWGLFQYVRITDRSGRPWRVLLFKSNSHLAHSPWLAGLSEMLRCIMTDTKADRLYTIGTAGGARLDQRLGDSIISNAAMLDLIRPQNTGAPGNGNMYRCPTWFPDTTLLQEVEGKLLFKLNCIATPEALAELFSKLQAKHIDDPSVFGLELTDLLNDALNPATLGTPRIQTLKDVPLLSTDFYYIASGDHADAYAFLEMDDAVIAREANNLGVRFACIRNISDPIVPATSRAGRPIADAVRGDWSGLIYSTYGLFTSFNGALATWCTIAGEGAAAYTPARNQPAPLADDPLEVKLAFEVRGCGTCDFFWPKEARQQPYGPYTAYDFDVNIPFASPEKPGKGSQPWVLGRTRPPSFPNAAIMAGCRKAPIMTIGINPNLTAFLPGQTGAAWAYPDFSSTDQTDEWTKYAWYYRYRTVSQERLDFDFARKFILPEGRIIAAGNGQIVGAERPSSSQKWIVKIRYDAEPSDTVIELPGAPGDFPYMLFFDQFPPANRFAAGDVIAGKIAVPGGIQVPVLRQQQGYYQQFVPVLQQFEQELQKDHSDARLRMGEDVSQIDMVACASPHWNPFFLGNTEASEDTVTDNCVSRNAWAIKQLIQSRPAILYVVSISSWKMFSQHFGAHIKRDIPPFGPPGRFRFHVAARDHGSATSGLSGVQCIRGRHRLPVAHPAGDHAALFVRH